MDFMFLPHQVRLQSPQGFLLKDFTAQIVKACYLDEDDPAACWKGVFDKASEVKRLAERSWVLSHIVWFQKIWT